MKFPSTGTRICYIRTKTDGLSLYCHTCIGFLIKPHIGLTTNSLLWCTVPQQDHTKSQHHTSGSRNPQLTTQNWHVDRTAQKGHVLSPQSFSSKNPSQCTVQRYTYLCAKLFLSVLFIFGRGKKWNTKQKGTPTDQQKWLKLITTP